MEVFIVVGTRMGNVKVVVVLGVELIATQRRLWRLRVLWSM